MDVNDFNNFIIDKLTNIEINNAKLIVAKSEFENKKFWRIREEIPLAEKLLKNVIQHDVSLPLNSIEKFIVQSTSLLKKLNTNLDIINFGHLGDNNLHFNVFLDENLKPYEYKVIREKINNIVFSNVKNYNGSISAEHGIGQLRRNELKSFKSSGDIIKMKQIKKSLIQKG